MLPDAIDGAQVLAQMRPALLRFFQRRCDERSEAEDLVQEVMVRALAHSRWSSDEQARAYVFRAAMNLWRDRKRRRLAREAVVVGWADRAVLQVGEEITVERVLIGRDQLRQVLDALMELNPRTRDIFILRRVENMKFGDIAAAFGITVSAVEKHMIKALACIAQRMQDHEND